MVLMCCGDYLQRWFDLSPDLIQVYSVEVRVLMVTVAVTGVDMNILSRETVSGVVVLQMYDTQGLGNSVQLQRVLSYGFFETTDSAEANPGTFHVSSLRSIWKTKALAL